MFSAHNQVALASHAVAADPAGGNYSSNQLVALVASQNSTIYFTTDGSEPSNSSSVYLSPIEITSNTTLKFFAEIPNNHRTSVITETYTVMTQVIATDPDDGETGVSKTTTISATFSKPMDQSTITTDTFILLDRDNIQFTGSITYNGTSNTATFIPDDLFDSVLYTVVLKKEIADVSGNNLEGDYSWKFSTGPDLLILLFAIEPDQSELLGGGTFTITPDPYTLTGSLTIEDNVSPDEDPTDGFIFISDIEFGTFVVSETRVPNGFGNIYDNVTVTAHVTNTLPFAEFRNRNLTVPITDFPPPEVTGVEPPFLSIEQFDLYKDSVQVGIFLGFQGPTGFSDPKTITAVGPDQLPGGRLETSTTLDPQEVTLESVLFSTSAPAGSSAEDLFTTYLIPTYPDIDPSIISDTFYFVPAFVIPYGESGNNYLLTPMIRHIEPGLTLVLEQPSYVASNEAKVDRVNMTFNTPGNNIGFSFAITDERPPGTPEPPLDVKALFLEIDFVGDVDFSNPAAFESLPVIDILVNKTLAGFDQLPDGCVDFRLLLFNEGTGDWDEISQLRDPTRDTEIQCGFTLSPEHFSKFAVGGVKGQTISTESDSDRNRNGGGGGGSRSAAVTPTAGGDDIEASVNTQSGDVLVHFTRVEDGGGQLKINSNELSSFEDLFDELAYFKEDNDEHGITNIEGKSYATIGDVLDIDASKVDFEGKVYVTVSYDEVIVSKFGSEDDVRFIHYNEEFDTWEDTTMSVDNSANTVTGELDSLSPVASAIVLNGGLPNTDPSQDNTMLWIESANPSFSVTEVGQIELNLDLNNTRSIEQEYVVLVQIVDQQNIVQFIEWRAGSLEASGGSETSMNWDDIVKGEYEVQILILSGLENPQLLSSIIHANLLV